MESGAHDGGDGDRRFLLTTTRFPTRTRLSIPPVYTVSRDKQAKYGFWRKRSGAPPCVSAPSPEERTILSSAHFCLRTRSGRLYGPRGLQSTLSRKQAADVEDNPMLLTVSIDHARVSTLINIE